MRLLSEIERIQSVMGIITEDQESKKHFIENFAIGVNYNFKTKYLSVGAK